MGRSLPVRQHVRRTPAPHEARPAPRPPPARPILAPRSVVRGSRQPRPADARSPPRPALQASAGAGRRGRGGRHDATQNARCAHAQRRAARLERGFMPECALTGAGPGSEHGSGSSSSRRRRHRRRHRHGPTPADDEAKGSEGRDADADARSPRMPLCPLPSVPSIQASPRSPRGRRPAGALPPPTRTRGAPPNWRRLCSKERAGNARATAARRAPPFAPRRRLVCAGPPWALRGRLGLCCWRHAAPALAKAAVLLSVRRQPRRQRRAEPPAAVAACRADHPAAGCVLRCAHTSRVYDDVRPFPLTRAECTHAIWFGFGPTVDFGYSVNLHSHR